MRQQNGLRALGVRVAGHYRVDVFLGTGDQRRRQRRDRLEQPSTSSPDKEPQVYGDLVIATPPRMELAAQWAELLLQSLLDRHVDVFRGRHPALTRGELCLELGADLPESDVDAHLFFGGQHPSPDQRLRPGATAGDVLAEEPSVDLE